MTKVLEKIIVENDADQVRCDGGGGALGHPAVWYRFDKSDKVECAYCDRVFVKKRAHRKIKAVQEKRV